VHTVPFSGNNLVPRFEITLVGAGILALKTACVQTVDHSKVDL